MKAEQIDQALRQKFVTEDERLVFWHDEDGEFEDHVAEGLDVDLGHVTVLDVGLTGSLATKIRLEREDPTGKYLIYSSGERPEDADDWLLDIRLYSAEFHADVSSIWLQEFGLEGLHLREHLKKRAAFLGSQERRRKLAKILSPEADEVEIDQAMVAVLVGSANPDPFAVLRALYHSHVEDGRLDLAEEPEAMAILEKLGLDDVFWASIAEQFDYEAAERTTAGLLRRLLVSELLHHLDGKGVDALAQFDLGDSGRRNAAVFLTQWRDSTKRAGSYDAAAAAVASELKIGEVLGEFSLEALREVETFWDVEKRIVQKLRDRVLEEDGAVDPDKIRSVAADRKVAYWLSGPGRDQSDRRAVRDAYNAIVAASDLLASQAQYRDQLKFEDVAQALEAYHRDLFEVDQAYRRFWTAARPAQKQGWDLLKDLSAEVERAYDQGFLTPLGLEWSRLLDAGFLETWEIEGVRRQQEFYRQVVKPHLSESERKRAFVIISDAFRYEAASELTRRLNGIYRFSAEIEPMLGVLPSYTALGMASLLPHSTLSYSEAGDVLVDGNSTSGTAARDKQLATVNGMACQASDLLNMKLEEVREFTRDKRVVYIYHNVIDARGDYAATEGETFEAVTQCIEELVQLVEICINRLSAGKVWVTADHGFLYQENPPTHTDKSKLSHKPDQAVTSKKRYVIGPKLGRVDEAHFGDTQATACAEGGMHFWVPRGSNRFHFTGGARFVHGGAMPQEVVVPLVTATHLRDSKREVSQSQKVSVQVLGVSHKITTPVYRFEIIQTEAVGERRKPLTVRAAVYEGQEPVSSVETVTFESSSSSIDDRKRAVRVELKAGTFDKSTPYRFVLRDVETDAEVQAVQVTIDRSFEDDF